MHYIKTLHRSYGPSIVLETAARLQPGERTPVFMVGDRFVRFSWFVRLPVDIIVTYGTAAVAAAKQATSSIPIVFGGAGDPVGAGLVASLGRPAVIAIRD